MMFLGALAGPQSAAERGHATRGAMKQRLPFDFDRKHLLLVAGVSGAGKSTFIAALKRGTLPPEIQRALPADARSWRVALSRDRRGRIFGRGNEPAPRGQILHHEITQPYRSGQRRGVQGKPARIYRVEDSPKLVERVGAAERVYVVIIHAPKETLVRQLSERTAVVHFPLIARSRAGRYAQQIQRVERALPNWLTANAAKVLGRAWARRAHMRSVNERLTNLYAEPGAVEDLHRTWEASLHEVCGSKLAAPFLYVEPAAGQRSAKTFRLAQPAFEARSPRRYAS